MIYDAKEWYGVWIRSGASEFCGIFLVEECLRDVLGNVASEILKFLVKRSQWAAIVTNISIMSWSSFTWFYLVHDLCRTVSGELWLFTNSGGGVRWLENSGSMQRRFLKKSGGTGGEGCLLVAVRVVGEDQTGVCRSISGYLV